MAKAGFPGPKFEDKGHSFVVILYQLSDSKTMEEQIDFDELNERQKKALELTQGGAIKTADLTEIFNEVEPRTVRRVLNDLVKKGVLEAKGKTRNRYYELKKITN